MGRVCLERMKSRTLIGLKWGECRTPFILATGLGAGELSTIALAEELKADLVLIDEWRARRYALEKGLAVIGCVGVLEELHQREHMSDLRGAYQRLIQHKTRIDLKTLQQSLAKFDLHPL